MVSRIFSPPPKKGPNWITVVCDFVEWHQLTHRRHYLVIVGKRVSMKQLLSLLLLLV